MKTRLVFFGITAIVFLSLFPCRVHGQADGGYQMKKIVLDPGHGGRDGGTSPAGVREKDIVLDVALRVGALLNQHLPDVEVIYTRKTDVFIGLMDRAQVANRAKADLFVSIHANAVENNTTANGSSTHVMGISKESTNLEVAMRENNVITYEEDYETKYSGFDPNDPASYIMFSLMQSAHFEQSIKLATIFQKHYGQNTTISTTRGVKQDAFLVLHHTMMPAVLTEMGFLTNASDRRYMTSDAGKNAIARSIFNAISEYKSMVEGNARIVVTDASGNEQNVAIIPAATEISTASTNDNGVVFRIQVSASTSKINTNNRNRFGQYAGQVAEKRIGNYYKYFVGETNSYAEALSLQRQVREKFRDAFVVAFDNDEPVTITDEMRRQ